jgi:D-sedoheptulose 7-phosphate isomerase
MKPLIKQRIEESVAVKKALLLDENFLDAVEGLARAVIGVIASGGRILLCGNGGSASDALHIAGELVGRFQRERGAWSAIVLNADVAAMTAIANDYGYENVFARQAAAHVRPGDLLIGFSTSGNSENVRNAVRTARELGAQTAALTGNDGGKLGKMVDFSLIVPSDVTARVQESHILIGHILCEIVEERLGGFYESGEEKEGNAEAQGSFSGQGWNDQRG